MSDIVKKIENYLLSEEYDADKEALDQAVASGVDDEDELPWN